jgi:hypothetical protein
MNKSASESRTRKTLSAKQLEAIEFLMDNPNLSYEATAEMLGIARKTLYNWRHNELFKNELDKRLKDRWKDSERLAIDTMVELCKTGNYNATKYILDSLGYSAPNKIEVKGEISNPMAELTLEELRKLAVE